MRDRYYTAVLSKSTLERGYGSREKERREVAPSGKSTGERPVKKLYAI